MEEKFCAWCETKKPVTEFHRNKNSKDKLSNKCKTCESRYHKQRYQSKKSHRKSHLKRAYKLTVAQVNIMHKEQDGKCKICLMPSTKLVVDHDHVTGAARGLLCPACNHGLGRFRDNPRTILNAFTYLTQIDSSSWYLVGASDDTNNKEVTETTR